MTDTIKLTGRVRSMYSGDMSAITWTRLAEMKPMPMLPFDSTLLQDHCRKFVRDRRVRIEKVSKMDLKRQCRYYRSLGYF